MENDVGCRVGLGGGVGSLSGWRAFNLVEPKNVNGRPTESTDRTEGRGEMKGMRRVRVCCVVRALSAFRGPLGTLQVQATAESYWCMGT